MLSLALASALYVASVSASFSLSADQSSAISGKTPLAETDNVVTLSRKKGSRSAAYLRTIRASSPVDGTFGTDPVISAEEGQEFITDIQFAGQNFQVILDTGSSDTWLASSSFSCVNVTTGAAASQAECMFGPLFTPGFSFQEIPNENFNITYGDGEFLTGVFGTDSVTLANITVSNQQVASVTFAGWEGDGVTSGLVGLAFPNITSAFAGTDPSADSPASQIAYNPIFTNMYTEGSVPALFSLALDRNNATGVLALGGTPSGLDLTAPNASTPIQYLNVDDESTTQYTFYTVNVGASLAVSDESLFGSGRARSNGPFRFSRSTTSSKAPRGLARPRRGSNEFQAIVDSGTTLLYLPDELSEEFNFFFDPPAEYDPDEGVYFVECGATPARLSIDVNGTSFAVNAQDLVLDVGEGTCISGVTDAGDSFSILGDVFLKSVLAVFDVGAKEITFVEHDY